MHCIGVDYHKKHSYVVVKDEQGKRERKGMINNTRNGSEFINQILCKYCQREGLEFTRSRANRKNDNAYIFAEKGSNAIISIAKNV